LNDGTIVTSWSGRINPAGTWTDSSGVFVSTDGGNTWVDRSDPGMVYWTMDVVIDPYDVTQNTWYAGVFSGWGSTQNLNDGGLYRTTNRGVSWTRINTETRVYSITFDPNHAGVAYMTSETQGLWYSSNVEATNPTFVQLPGYPFRQPNRVYFNPYDQTKIWVNSFGNGLRMGDLTVGINEVNSFTNDVNIYPNPTNGEVTLNYGIKETTNLTVTLSNINGQVIFTEQSKQNEGIYNHIFNLSQYSKGIYFLNIITDKENIVKKVVLD
jgi:hypothetical protein